jgi:hypothetical protein
MSETLKRCLAANEADMPVTGNNLGTIEAEIAARTMTAKTEFGK